ncbi:MAG: alpha/beta fold hydrolase [Flavobacteriaceae bacterium]|nr:alpha/beta fold hydrolase [Candidatus Onthonaster equi]
MEQDIIHSKIIGSGTEHLIILHGLFGQLDNWNTHARQFGEIYTTHIVDLRNHGRSFHSDFSTIRVMAEDVLNYMNFHQIDKAHLIGHSLGGRIVMDFAMLYPDRLNHLVVADMAPKAYEPHHNAIFKALSSVDFSQVTSRKDVEEILAQYIPEIGVRQFLLKNVYHAEDGQYAFRFNLPVLHQSYSDLVGQNLLDGIFNGPTLFLKGEKSNYIMPEDEFIIKKRFPNSAIKTIANAGHWLHAENPKDFISTILTFLI